MSRGLCYVSARTRAASREAEKAGIQQVNHNQANTSHTIDRRPTGFAIKQQNRLAVVLGSVKARRWFAVMLVVHGHESLPAGTSTWTAPAVKPRNTNLSQVPLMRHESAQHGIIAFSIITNNMLYIWASQSMSHKISESFCTEILASQSLNAAPAHLEWHHQNAWNTVLYQVFEQYISPIAKYRPPIRSILIAYCVCPLLLPWPQFRAHRFPLDE